MIQLTKSGNAIKFIFDDNDHYLYNGTIEVPVNSLTLVTDESGMFTFKKSATNDIFISGLYSEIGMTKAELETFYKNNMVGSTGGSGGTTPEEVQQMINESISGKQDTLIAGEHITISGNVISAEAGTVPYDGYSMIELFTGNPWELEKIDTPFYVVSGTQFCFEYKGNGEENWGDYTCALLDWTNHTSSFQEQGAEEFVSVTWDAKYNAFKFDTLQEGHDITYVGGIGNWGYAKDILPSGTTNETFDNVIEYVIDSDNALNSNLSSKFDNYLTTSAASNTYLAKENSAAIKYTQGMFESGETNINGGIIFIQNGFEKYNINTPYGSEYSPNYGKGILEESFVFGMGNALAHVLWNDSEDFRTWIFGIPQAEVFNGGLVGRKVFVIWDKSKSAAIYFKCENATITSGETQIDFDLSGKIYFDDECTKEYKSYPDWSVQGTVTSDGEVNGYFSAQQLERDGFFGNKTQKQGVFYDENGGEHKIPRSFNTYTTLGNSRYHEGLSELTFCLVNNNINGNYYSYILDGSLVSYQSRRMSVGGNISSYMNVNVPFVDYSKLSPLGFEYVVDDNSTNNQGTYGIKYKNTGYTLSTHFLSVSINGIDYTLAKYSETEQDLVYNDESVSGVYTITIDGDGYRTLMSNVNAHYSISYGYSGNFEIPTVYYLHYSNETSQITSGEVQTMIDESLSGYVETSAITTSVTSASTDSEIPTAKAVYDAIPTGGSASYSAGTNIDITNNVISFTPSLSAGTGTNSIAEGEGSIANGYASHAEGDSTTATSDSSHAEGHYTKASGDSSHAEGSMTQAIGDYSHAEGYLAIANGSSSHAEGENSIANGKYSHAEGYLAIANNKAEHASGQYNVSSSASTTFGDSGNTLFSVGNGTSTSARHNAFEIRQNGDIYLSYNGNDVKLQDLIADIYSKLPTS